MNNRILLVVIISLCIVMSYAQNEPEKRNLVDSSCSLSKTTITFRYFDDKPIIVDSNDNLNRAVQILKQNPQLKIVVEGYANDYNSAQDNSDLAQRRANQVRDIFIQKGVPQNQIEIVTYSVNDPYATQDSEGHRTVIFRIVKREGKESAVSNEIPNALPKAKIFFNSNKDIPIIKDQGENINKAVAILKTNPSLKLIVEGYTSDRGSEQHNRDLAQRRANNVRKLFIDKGVDPSQIETASYTVNDLQNRQNITDPSRKEHDCAIFRIVKR